MKCSASCPHWHVMIEGAEWVQWCGLMDRAEIGREFTAAKMSNPAAYECIAPRNKLPRLASQVELHIKASQRFLEDIEREIGTVEEAV